MVALLPGKFLRVQKVFACITEKPVKTSQYFQNDPDFSRWYPIFQIISKLSGFFQMIVNFPDGFKNVRIFPDHSQFSGRFQNCPDFSGSLPIFRTVSKLSWFFQMIVNFAFYCLALHCLALHCIILYCILAIEHWICVLWQCCERQSRPF